MSNKFDRFLNNREMIEKHQELREYFVKAQTQSDLEFAKQDAIDAMKNGELDKIPDEVLNFFYNERKKQLGPDLGVKNTTKSSPGSVTANIQRAIVSQTEQRPTLG